MNHGLVLHYFSYPVTFGAVPTTETDRLLLSSLSSREEPEVIFERKNNLRVEPKRSVDRAPDYRDSGDTDLNTGPSLFIPFKYTQNHGFEMIQHLNPNACKLVIFYQFSSLNMSVQSLDLGMYM